MSKSEMFFSNARSTLLAGLVLLALPYHAALACGYCVEDKLASVYDHAIVSRALSQKHQVLFFDIGGRLTGSAHERQILERGAGRALGVDADSIRVSVDTAALSFSIDPIRTPVPNVVKSLQGKLLLSGFSVKLLRIMDTPAMFSTPVNHTEHEKHSD